MQVNLAGKTALVTGASSGFGRHFALTLARSGARVIVAARRAAALADLVAEIERSSGQAEAMPLDVTNSGEVKVAIGRFEDIDIVVNNAGIAGYARALDCERGEWLSTFDTNVHGSWFVAREVATKMVERGSPGSIINIASITAYRPGAAAAYSSSKAAVVQMTRALAFEWARHGIRVNAIAPGYFETDLNRQALHSEFGQSMKRRIPQRRFGELVDLDGPLLLLASEASRYMTGSVIVVDGGHLCSVL